MGTRMEEFLNFKITGTRMEEYLNFKISYVKDMHSQSFILLKYL